MTSNTDPPPADPLREARTYTAEQAATLLGIPGSLIRRWQRAGKIAIADELPAPVPGGRQKLYRLSEIRPLAHAYLRRRG